MIDYIAIFEKLRFHPEDEIVEFKKAENSFDFDDLGKYFSALSNEANLRDKGFGWLIFGVHDKTREIIGTSFKNSMKSLQKLKHDIAQHLTDNNTFRDIYELSVGGKRVLLFQIPAAPRGIPVAWQGHFYARRGESLVALDMNKYEEIRHQTVNVDWTAVIVNDATIDDLDKDAIATKFATMYPVGVTILMPSGSELNMHIADVVMSKSRNAELIKGVICKLTTEEVDDIVLDFNSKFREFYKDEFNSKYYELGRYLDLMDKERNGYFSRHLIKNNQMRDALDSTLKLSDDRFAEFANKINGQDVLIIDDTISRGQSIKEACQIMLESYAPKSITVLTLLSKLN